MKLLFFLISYIVGASVFFVSSEHLLVYLFALFLYLTLTDYFAHLFHRILVIDPLVLSYASVMILSLLEGRGQFAFVQFLTISLFLYIYYRLRGIVIKEQYEKEEIKSPFYVKRLVLPLVYPVAVYFAVHFFLPETFTLYIFWMFYFFVVMYFTKYIQTAFYYGYFTIMQLIIIAYLFQYMSGMFFAEKTLLYFFLLATTTGRYLYTQPKGGKSYVSFIQTLFRKNLQKFKDRSGVRERR